MADTDSLSPQTPEVEPTDEDALYTFDPSKKRKKKPKKAGGVNLEEFDASTGAKESTTETSTETSSAAQTSTASGDSEGKENNGDYSYSELLARIYKRIVEDKGVLDGGKAKKTIEPASVGKMGTKKVVWMNFGSTCRSIGRPLDHVMEYVLTELGATGSVDAQNQFIIKGRYTSKALESVLTKYIKEYVACSTCRQLNTTLKKENRLTFKICNDCGASSSVASISKGFRVQTKRKKT